MNIYLIGTFFSFITVVVLITFCVKLYFYFAKKSSFPRKLLIFSLTGIVLVILLIGYTKYFFTFNHLEGEFYKGQVDSPTGKYTANSYFRNYGGAAGGTNVWVEITNNDENNKISTIYYSDGKGYFEMKWKDKNTIYIRNDGGTEEPGSDRSMELEIGKEIYDETGRACDSWLMKNEYETCYRNK